MGSEERYRKLYESAMHANAALQATMDHLQRLNETLEAEKRQWAAEKLVQQQVIQKTIDQMNALNNTYLEENKVLRDEVRRLTEMCAIYQEM